MKILIADDSKDRAKSILELIKNEYGLDESTVHTAHTSESALAKLRRFKYDILILDVVFKEINGSPDCKVSYQILKKIFSNKKYNTPMKVIGITAHLDDFSKYREEFNNYFCSIIEASNLNTLWKASILKVINYELKANTETNKHNDILCLMVHGIRTKGKWQNKFSEKIQQKIGEIKVAPYNYGFLDIISFFIPFFRVFTTYFFKRRLKACLEMNKGKTIYIFSHSFGTHLVVKSLDKLLKKQDHFNIEKIILSGSVLKSNFDFSRILKGTSAVIVNDCGESDYVLSASQAFVPNMGMAGKVGFYGFNNQRVVNRHFDGNHSHYFDDKSNFMDKYWIPLFYKSYEVKHIDVTTKESYFNAFIDVVSDYLGRVKEVIYIAIATWYFYPL